MVYAKKNKLIMEHFYQSIDGWFNMEKEYKYLLNKVPEGGTFVELGAWKGRSTAFLLVESANSGIHRNIHIVDTFAGSDKTPEEVEAYKGIDRAKIVAEFLNNISPVREYISSIIIENSALASHRFEDNSVDAIFIDAGHSYEDVSADIKAWYPKIKKGGILSGHDYNESWKGVMKAVDELLGKNNIHVQNSCWFFIKP